MNLGFTLYSKNFLGSFLKDNWTHSSVHEHLNYVYVKKTEY